MPVENDVAGVRLTNLDRVLYPRDTVTKSDIITYYVRIAPRMLPWLHQRAAVLHRFPEGIEKPGFFEKDAPQGTPAWVETFTRHSETAGRDVRHIVCNSVRTLIWMANLAAIEIHIPLSRSENDRSPDFLLFDIDPEPPAGFPEAREAALLVRERLDDLGFPPFVKTSGKKGLHVIARVAPDQTFRQTRTFAHTMGRFLARESSTIVAEATETKKPGTVFLDYLQNSHGKTMACPYSLRAAAGAPVSTPLSWEELEGAQEPILFTIRNVLSRKVDPWEAIAPGEQQEIRHE